MVRFRSGRLRRSREAAGLTRQQLAQLAGVRSADRVRDWERGVHAPQAHFVPRLATVLGIEPMSLFDVDPDAPPFAALRLIRGLSLEQLSRLASVPLMTCQRIEQGHSRPTAAVFLRLAAALAVDAPRLSAAVERGQAAHRADRAGS